MSKNINKYSSTTSGQDGRVPATTRPVVMASKATTKFSYVALQAQVENSNRIMQVMLVHTPGWYHS